MSKRLFIAFKIKPQKNLLQTYYELKQNLEGKIKWVDDRNFHITVKFLGETDENLIPEISNILTSIAEKYPKFNISIENIGTFPNPFKPRVLWFGVKTDEFVPQMAKEIDFELTRLDFEEENRIFTPHLTVARIKFLKNIDTLQGFIEENSGKIFQKDLIKELILYESILQPQGPVYKPLKIFALK